MANTPQSAPASSNNMLDKIRNGILSIIPSNPFKVYSSSKKYKLKAKLLSIESSRNIYDGPKEELPDDIKDAYGF
jgi:hypothetical protein